MFKANLIANQNIVSLFSVVHLNHALHQLAALPALPLLVSCVHAFGWSNYFILSNSK